MSTWPQLTAREEGELLALEPLSAEHEEDLFAVGQGPRRLALPHGISRRGRDPRALPRWMEQALAESAAERE